MRAAVFKRAGRPLSIETVPDPTPGPGDLVVKVGRCGICGTDLHMTETPNSIYHDGSILGHEFAGEVVAVGGGVEKFRIGDRVAAQSIKGCGKCPSCLAGERLWCWEMRRETQGVAGGFAEYALIRDQEATKLPASLSLADGALVEPLACSLHAANYAGIKGGERVVVIGAGPIALGTVFWARHQGATHVAVAASSTRRQDRSLEVGATSFHPQSDDLSAEIISAMGGPPDVVFECVGRPGMIELAINLVRERGQVIVPSLCMAPDRFLPVIGSMKEVQIRFAVTYSVKEFETVADVLAAGSLEPRAMISETVPLGAMPEMFEALRQHTNHCKVMVDPWAP